MKNLTLCENFLLVQPLKDNETAGGLVLSDTAVDKLALRRGKVVKAGPGKHVIFHDRCSRIDNTIKEGMTVLFKKGMGWDYDQDHIILAEVSIIGIID